jgi:hypothetical protein
VRLVALLLVVVVVTVAVVLRRADAAAAFVTSSTDAEDAASASLTSYHRGAPSGNDGLPSAVSNRSAWGRPPGQKTRDEDRTGSCLVS